MGRWEGRGVCAALGWIRGQTMDQCLNEWIVLGLTTGIDAMVVIAYHFGVLVWPGLSACLDMDANTFTIMCDPRGIPNMARVLPIWERSKEFVL